VKFTGEELIDVFCIELLIRHRVHDGHELFEARLRLMFCALGLKKEKEKKKEPKIYTNSHSERYLGFIE
jgi:hypothetical protein